MCLFVYFKSSTLMQKSIKSLFQPFQSRTRANRFSENYFLWISLVSNIVLLSITLLNVIFLLAMSYWPKKLKCRHLPVWLVCSRELDVLFGRWKREVRFDEDPRSGCHPDDPFERGSEESDGNCKKKYSQKKFLLFVTGKVALKVVICWGLKI